MKVAKTYWDRQLQLEQSSSCSALFCTLGLSASDQMEEAGNHKTGDGSHHWRCSWLFAVTASYTGTLGSALTHHSVVVKTTELHKTRVWAETESRPRPKQDETELRQRLLKNISLIPRWLSKLNIFPVISVNTALQNLHSSESFLIYVVLHMNFLWLR